MFSIKAVLNCFYACYTKYNISKENHSITNPMEIFNVVMHFS